MINGDVLLLERTIPDASGVRFILMSLAEVGSVRFIDPIREADFLAAGFTGNFSKH